MHARTHSGFTLIELSIVLVIIGLLVGGVLVGRDLIKASQIRADIAQIESIKTAINTFRLKYGHNCLPGDCANATSFFSAGSQPQQVKNGNGDGRIAGVIDEGWDPFNVVWWPIDNPIGEWSSVYDHLSAAGLVAVAQYDELAIASLVGRAAFAKMQITDGPTYGGLSMPGGIAVGYDLSHQYLTSGHKIRVGICASAGAIPSFGCGMLPPSAYTIDTKIDDGKPYTGSAVLAGPTTYVYRVTGTAEDNTVGCGDPSTNSYLLTTTVGGCALSINAGF